MNRLFLLAIVVGPVLGNTIARADEIEPSLPFPQPAFCADQFVDFIGINAAPFDRYLDSGPFKGAGSKFDPSLLFDLGVRHYRMVLKHDLTGDGAAEKVKAAFQKYGVKPMLLISPEKGGSPADVVQLLKNYGGNQIVSEVEFPSEVNNKCPPLELNLKYSGMHDEQAGAKFQDDYFKAIKADPETRDIPCVCYTAIFTDYRLAKPCDAFDDENMHSYRGYDIPSSSLLSNFIRANNILPVGGVIRPFVPTECGYRVEEDGSNHIKGDGSLRAQAMNIPMLLADYFQHGFIRRAYLFSLTNADGYGLLESDQVTKRPSYRALQSLISILKDSDWNSSTHTREGAPFRLKSLRFGVPHQYTVNGVTLQKRNGDHFVLLWNELPNFDSEKKLDRINPLKPIDLIFDTPIAGEVEVIRQDDSGEFKPSGTITPVGNSLHVELPSSVIILHIKAFPTPTPTTTPMPAPPTDVHGEATENVVKLSWNPPAGAKPDSYFVYRNGECISALSRSPAIDESPWVRPGLGYTYAVQCVDAAGNQSVLASSVVQTAPKFPDLFATELSPENDVIHPGDLVKFKIRIRNVGDGATPWGVGVGASFFVDGKLTSWCQKDGPLAAAAAFDLLADGGPSGSPNWIATPGAHVLSAKVDDLNRIPGEKSKSNNTLDRTFIVGDQAKDGSAKGELLGSSDPAPRKVNLTQGGQLDWVHWGTLDAKTVDRRAAANLIGDLTAIGKVPPMWTPSSAIAASWSNGMPTHHMDSNAGGLCLNGVNNGFTFTAPADPEERTLKIYAAGTEGVDCKFTATLSDNSAPPYVSTTWTGNRGQGASAPVCDAFSAVYTVRFRAMSPGQKLTVKYELTAEPNRLLGQARLTAATLARGS